MCCRPVMTDEALMVQMVVNGRRFARSSGTAYTTAQKGSPFRTRFEL